MKKSLKQIIASILLSTAPLLYAQDSPGRPARHIAIDAEGLAKEVTKTYTIVPIREIKRLEGLTIEKYLTDQEGRFRQTIEENPEIDRIKRDYLFENVAVVGSLLEAIPSSSYEVGIPNEPLAQSTTVYSVAIKLGENEDNYSCTIQVSSIEARDRVVSSLQEAIQTNKEIALLGRVTLDVAVIGNSKHPAIGELEFKEAKSFIKTRFDSFEILNGN